MLEGRQMTVWRVQSVASSGLGGTQLYTLSTKF